MQLVVVAVGSPSVKEDIPFTVEDTVDAVEGSSKGTVAEDSPFTEEDTATVIVGILGVGTVVEGILVMGVVAVGSPSVKEDTVDVAEGILRVGTVVVVEDILVGVGHNLRAAITEHKLME